MQTLAPKELLSLEDGEARVNLKINERFLRNIKNHSTTNATNVSVSSHTKNSVSNRRRNLGGIKNLKELGHSSPRANTIIEPLTMNSTGISNFTPLNKKNDEPETYMF